MGPGDDDGEEEAYCLIEPKKPFDDSMPGNSGLVVLG